MKEIRGVSNIFDHIDQELNRGFYLNQLVTFQHTLTSDPTAESNSQPINNTFVLDRYRQDVQLCVDQIQDSMSKLCKSPEMLTHRSNEQFMNLLE